MVRSFLPCKNENLASKAGTFTDQSEKLDTCSASGLVQQVHMLPLTGINGIIESVSADNITVLLDSKGKIWVRGLFKVIRLIYSEYEHIFNHLDG
jgi:hypothetical protein